MIITRIHRSFNFAGVLAESVGALIGATGALMGSAGAPKGEVAVRLKDASFAEGSPMSNPDVSPAIIDKASSSDLQYIPLADVHGTLTSLFGWKDVQSTE